MKGILSLSILIILFSSLVTAQPDIIVNKYQVGYTFEPFNVPDIVCNCQILNDQYIIRNTADITQAFSITVTEGLVLNQKIVTLKPGRSAVIVASAPLVCNAKDFTYDINVVSSLGEQKGLTRTVETETCQNLNLALFPEGNITPDSNVTWVLQLNNLGPFTETYIVSAETFEEYANSEAYELTLQGNQAHNITFNYDFPPGLWGNHTMEFKARALSNKLIASVEQDILIERDYDFLVQTEEQTVCTELDNEITFNVTNNGAIYNYYTFNILGTLGYKLNETQIGLDVGETKTVKIIPDKNTPTYDELLLQVETSYGSIQTEIKIPVNVINCYDLQIKVPQKISQCDEINEYDIELRNNGILDEEIQIILNGNATISDENVFLSPNQSQNISIIVNPEGSLDEMLSLNITGSAGIHNLYSIPLIAANEYECRLPELQKTSFTTTKQQFSTELLIKNLGEKDANYSLSIDNNANINSNLYVSAKNQNTANFDVDFSDRDYGSYGFTLYIDTADQSYENVITVEFKERNVFQRSIDFLNINYCLWIMIGIIVLIILAIITLIFLPRSVFRNAWFSLGTLIIILALVLGFFAMTYFKGLPEPVVPSLENDVNELHYRAYEGEQFLFNLDEFFFDLDGDSLIYNVTGDNIEYLLEGNIVSFAALSEGTYLVNFVASDLDTTTTSPPVTMEVVKKPGIKSLDFALRYCCWINYCLAIILGLFIIAILWKGKTRFIRKVAVETKTVKKDSNKDSKPVKSAKKSTTKSAKKTRKKSRKSSKKR